MSDDAKHWETWTPWLFNENDLVSDVVDSIPHAPKVPWVVRLFESPNSPFYLPAPTTMRMHDTIHVILGRGLLNQDEAFVIGFGMGLSLGKNQIKRMVFEFVSTTLYPKAYQFSNEDRKIFNLAFELAQTTPSSNYNIHLDNERELGRMSVKEVRNHYGIDAAILKKWYQQEHTLCPKTIVSKRLPVEKK